MTSRGRLTAATCTVYALVALGPRAFVSALRMAAAAVTVEAASKRCSTKAPPPAPTVEAAGKTIR